MSFFDEVESTVEGWWGGMWDWVHNSGTILYTRLVAAFGAAVTFVGGMDWSPLWSFLGTGTAFTKQQLVSIGISIVGAAVTGEIVRRSKTKIVDNQILPTNAVLSKNRKKK